MTLTADERLPANYMQVYWSDSNGLPAPKGLFAKHLEKEKSHAIQWLKAAKLLHYINSAPRSFDHLAHTAGLPFPMLIDVMVPTEDQWFDKRVKKDNGQNIKSWFQQSAALKDNKEQEMAMVCPCLPYWAYDAFTRDVPAHELWERIHVADTDDCVAV